MPSPGAFRSVGVGAVKECASAERLDPGSQAAFEVRRFLERLVSLWTVLREQGPEQQGFQMPPLHFLSLWFK